MALLVGRWKGALVAVKVIDHRIKGNGNSVDIQREAILSTSVVHPNVVQYRSSLIAECSVMLCCPAMVLAAALVVGCFRLHATELHTAQVQRSQTVTQEP